MGIDKAVDQHNTTLVVKRDGQEVGRIAATDDNASLYLERLAQHCGYCEVDVEDADAAMVFSR